MAKDTFENLLEIEKIAGSGDESFACSVFAKKIAASDAGVGTLVSVVSLENKGDEDLQTALRDVFEIVTKKLEGAQTSTLEALRLSIGAGVEYLLRREVRASLAALFFYDEVCYIGKFGDKVKILVFEKSKSVEIDFEFGSGPVEAGQTYLVATESFLKIFDRSVIESDESLAEIRDGLATEISSHEDQSAVAAALVGVLEGGISEVGKKQEEDEETKARAEETIEEVENDGDEAGEEAGKEVREESKKKGLFLKKIFSAIRALKVGDRLAIFRLRRSLAVIACLILVLLAISVGLAIRQKSERERVVQFETHMSAASSKYSEGAGIFDLNRQRAREILVEADREIGAALALFKNSEEAKKLADDIESKLKETESRSEVDFKTVFAGEESLSSLAENDRGLVGISDNKLIEVDLRGARSSEVDLDKSGFTSGFVFDGKAFLINSEGVIRVDLVSEKETKVVDDGNAQDIAVFLGNIYLLSERQIVKHVPIEGGYSQAVDYLAEEVDFGERSRFAIDGSIWVSSGKKIYKFTRGVSEAFEVLGLSEIGEFSPIYTNSALDNLYVIDVANSALLVIGKDGLYKRSYQSGEFSRATDLVVSEVDKKVYLSSANRIIEASLE